MMRRTARTVILIVFVCVILGCAFAVLYLGTSTGLTFGDAGTATADETGARPVYEEVGWIRNTAPWPVTIRSIETNSRRVASSTTVFLERAQTGRRAASGREPDWVAVVTKAPYKLDGGALRYLGFAMRPVDGEVASMTSITVTYSGPLGFVFHSTFSGTRVAAASSSLPAGILAADPVGDSASLDVYILLLRTALVGGDLSQLVAVMGNGATPADASALLRREKGYLSTDRLLATQKSVDRYTDTLVFSVPGSTTGSLPPITVTWADDRWSVVRPK